ncbi:AGAP005468-PA-like protein [Anopheles sinensis]|uniref:AGAP005468-PA-like protein n=1 Tax=Anopheles sinensis TaxID=74873 RepID=A0A084W2V8_ANOSI|nr:AGAP005468-PA-like protein [Anopheles sinensis]
MLAANKFGCQLPVVLLVLLLREHNFPNSVRPARCGAMGKDSGREKDTTVGGGSKKAPRPVSASPYSEHYRPPIDLCQRHLINHRLLVSKLTRRELEDKYISLCDENYSMKKRFLEQEDQIKRLKTRLMRLSSESTGRSKSRLDLSSSEHYNKLHDLEVQRRDLHEKLEALRRATTFEGGRVGSASRSTGNGTARHGPGTSTSSYRRAKSAHREKERDPRRECKSSSPSNDGYDEDEGGGRVRRLRRRVGKDRASTDRTEEDEEEEEEDTHEGGNRGGHRKSYGADDEEDDDDDDEERDEQERGRGAAVDEDDEVDEDRDVVSCDGADGSDDNREQDSATGGGASRTKHSKEPRKPSRTSRTVRGHCADCERHRTEHLTRETDLVKMKLNIKYLHKELQNEKEKSALLARQLEEKLSYEIMKRNAAENLEIVNLNRQVDDLAKELQRQVDEQKRSMEHEIRKQGDLETQIRKEKDKNAELFEECERLKKSIEKLKENMSEVEIERDFLKRQQENFTKIVDENKLLKYQLDELRRHNEELLKQIDSLREEELVTKESQRELLEKLKTLQQDNDTLSVMLEGLRTENEMLAEERSQLELSLKSLEASPIKEIRPLSPQKPSTVADASVQTVSDSVVRSPIDEGNSLRKQLVMVQEPSPQRESSEVEVAYEDVDPPPRNSRGFSAKVSRERHDHEMAEAAQLVFRQASGVNRMIPKLSHIMNNRTDEPTKPSNLELLTANSYPAALEKTFRASNRFYDMQKEVRRGNVDRSSISSTTSDKRKISFVDSTGTDESPTKDEENFVQENYARFFNIHELPTIWHNIVANPTPIGLFAPSPTRVSNSPPDEVVTIEIRSLRWHTAALERLLAAKVTQYYIEFVFLDLHGHRLETVPSANLQPIQDGALQYQLYHEFNFPVRIELDAPVHGKRREQLKAMLNSVEGHDAVRFVVVNEGDNRSGEDIGYASVSLRRELLNATEQQESVVVDTIIYDFCSPHEELGVLRIVLGNVKLLRSLIEPAPSS